MTTLDFPVAPLVGDRFPTPSVAGMPQYIWDGEKWTTATNTITTAPPSTSLPLEDNATASIGVTTKYAREDHVHPSTALKYSAQTLSEAQKAQSRTNLYAAPFDVQAYSGLQINGSCDISQELGTTGTSAAAGSPVDNWKFSRGGTNVVTAAQYPLTNQHPGFSNIIGLTVGTVQASLGAGDLVHLVNTIEGNRIARLGWGTANAQPITIGFWTAHNPTGLYSGAIRNGAANRSYVFTYTQNVAGVYEYKTVTIPGDTAGTWPKDNAAGMSVVFTMACGSTYTAPAVNTWYSANYIAAPGQTNGVASTSNIFRITGLIVLPGIEAPSAERSPLIMRPYDQELLMCYRYYQGAIARIGGYAVPGATLAAWYTFPVLMRATPTVTPVFVGTSNLSSFGADTLTAIGFRYYGVSSVTGSILVAFDSCKCDARL